jgi:hypothetical protein
MAQIFGWYRQSGQLQLLFHDFSPLRQPRSGISGLELILMMAPAASKPAASTGHDERSMQTVRQLFET